MDASVCKEFTAFAMSTLLSICTDTCTYNLFDPIFTFPMAN